MKSLNFNLCQKQKSCTAFFLGPLEYVKRVIWSKVLKIRRGQGNDLEDVATYAPSSHIFLPFFPLTATIPFESQFRTCVSMYCRQLSLLSVCTVGNCVYCLYVLWATESIVCMYCGQLSLLSVCIVGELSVLYVLWAN